MPRKLEREKAEQLFKQFMEYRETGSKLNYSGVFYNRTEDFHLTSEVSYGEHVVIEPNHFETAYTHFQKGNSKDEAVPHLIEVANKNMLGYVNPSFNYSK